MYHIHAFINAARLASSEGTTGMLLFSKKYFFRPNRKLSQSFDEKASGIFFPIRLSQKIIKHCTTLFFFIQQNNFINNLMIFFSERQ